MDSEDNGTEIAIDLRSKMTLSKRMLHLQARKCEIILAHNLVARAHPCEKSGQKSADSSEERKSGALNGIKLSHTPNAPERRSLRFAKASAKRSKCNTKMK